MTFMDDLPRCRIKEPPNPFFSSSTLLIPCPTPLPRMYSKQAAMRHVDQGPSLGKRRSRHKAKAHIRRPRVSSDTSDSGAEHPPSEQGTDNARDRGSPNGYSPNGDTSDNELATRRPRSTKDLATLSGSRKRGPSDLTGISCSARKKMRYVFTYRSHARIVCIDAVFHDTRTDVHSLLHLAWAIPRCIGPFTNIRTTFLAGFDLSADVNREPALRSE